MTTVRDYNDQFYVVYTKGAPEFLIDLCTKIEDNTSGSGEPAQELSDSEK